MITGLSTRTLLPVNEPAELPATEPAETLAAVLAQHQIELPERQVTRLDKYCRALWEWNEKINLTRHTDYQKFVTRNVVDSLQLPSNSSSMRRSSTWAAAAACRVSSWPSSAPT